jgi:menaquinone-dependent protoporphyrinogen oxidase
MNPLHVLVAYGSRNGGTEGIAEVVAATLRECGIDAQAREAAGVRDLRGYEAVILGGALYNRQWHRDAQRFSRRHGTALRERPAWLFSSGPLDAAGAASDPPPVPAVAAVANRIGARGHRTFGGRLDDGAKGFIAHAMVRNGRGGDFRDMEQVSTWAREVAASLRQVPVQQTGRTMP